MGMVVKGMRPRRAQAHIAHRETLDFVRTLFMDSNTHAKKVDSLANAVTGAVHAADAGIAAIGAGLAAARGLNPKHATKQVDRMLSSKKGIALSVFFELWVPWVLAERTEVFVNLDWTDFDDVDQTVCVLGAQTYHGRSTPLVWKTVHKSELKECRNDIEDELLREFVRVMPDGVRVTVVADRGFSDIKLYEMLTDELRLDYIIRFRNCVHVAHGKQKKPVRGWLSASGRLRTLKGATVTCQDYPVGAVVMVHDKAMQDAWFLATSRDDLGGRDIVERYGKRFSIEETFRDYKDRRFGLGLKQVRIKDCQRRDRMLMVATLAHALLTLLGQAGEDCGLDRYLKVNTSKRRQHSLFRQGLMWFDLIPNMKRDRLRKLMKAFGERLLQHRLTTETLGLL